MEKMNILGRERYLYNVPYNTGFNTIKFVRSLYAWLSDYDRKLTWMTVNTARQSAEYYHSVALDNGYKEKWMAETGLTCYELTALLQWMHILQRVVFEKIHYFPARAIFRRNECILEVHPAAIVGDFNKISKFSSNRNYVYIGVNDVTTPYEIIDIYGIYALANKSNEDEPFHIFPVGANESIASIFRLNDRLKLTVTSKTELISGIHESEVAANRNKIHAKGNSIVKACVENEVAIKTDILVASLETCFMSFSCMERAIVAVLSDPGYEQHKSSVINVIQTIICCYMGHHTYWREQFDFYMASKYAVPQMYPDMSYGNFDLGKFIDYWRPYIGTK